MASSVSVTVSPSVSIKPCAAVLYIFEWGRGVYSVTLLNLSCVGLASVLSVWVFVCVEVYASMLIPLSVLFVLLHCHSGGS